MRKPTEQTSPTSSPFPSSVLYYGKPWLRTAARDVGGIGLSGPYAVMGEASRSYDVARDGRFLMMLPADQNSAPTPGSIIVVQNFTEELKRRVRRSGP